MPKEKVKYLRSVSVDELIAKNKVPTAISLFSGCGGCALGLNAAGYEIRVFVEWDKWACETLRCNWTRKGHIESCDARIKSIMTQPAYSKKEKKQFLESVMRDRNKKKWARWSQKREPAIMNVDITKTSTAEILKAGGLEVGEAFILEGGFPCQGFSYANSNRRVDDSRNRLYLECVRVIHESLPRTFLLENVPGLVSMAKGAVVRKICEDLATCGYNISWDIHNAADYGVPQNRRRVLFIGLRNDASKLDMKTGRMGYWMGYAKGTIKYPEWFEKKYPLKK